MLPDITSSAAAPPGANHVREGRFRLQIKTAIFKNNDCRGGFTPHVVVGASDFWTGGGLPPAVVWWGGFTSRSRSDAYPRFTPRSRLNPQCYC